jgi:D-inositol-3-phosphate glycosyltransferase
MVEAKPRRVAMLSAHTSPLEQPGSGDAGGMNVYVLELSRKLARSGFEVDMFTRATSRHQPLVIDVEPGIRVHNVAAGPFEGLNKNELPTQMCSFVRDVLRVEARHEPGYFDLIHSHYWLSGQVGTVLRDRWNVPLVHTMHTMAKVKNAALAEGDEPEPRGRERGEEEIVRLADRLIANTDEERHELIDLYSADRDKVRVVHPGVDLSVFRPRATPQEPPLILFAGRIQPLKAPDLVLKASALLSDVDHRVVIVGGVSGNGVEHPDALSDLARDLGIADRVDFHPAVSQSELAEWYSRAAVVCVPSYNESFGLVALEAQACGTPVVAAHVGGLGTAVVDGVTGTLVAGHEPAAFAQAIRPYLTNPQVRSAASAKAVDFASGFGWNTTAAKTIEVYEEALQEFT